MTHETKGTPDPIASLRELADKLWLLERNGYPELAIRRAASAWEAERRIVEEVAMDIDKWRDDSMIAALARSWASRLCGATKEPTSRGGSSLSPEG